MTLQTQTFSAPRITLEQWRSLAAVVEAGGYAQAAETLHKSQSTVTYAVQQLESQLGVKAFQIEGRRAKLTPTGELLYRRAQYLLEEAAGEVGHGESRPRGQGDYRAGAAAAAREGHRG